jgi:hypothetical protein
VSRTARSCRRLANQRQTRPTENSEAPFVEGLDGFGERHFEDDAEAFFEIVGPAEGWVRLDDPGQLHLLFLGEVFGVLPECVTAVLDASSPGAIRPGGSVCGRPATGAAGVVLSGGFPGLVPRGSPHFVERVAGPFHDVERVGAANGVGAFLGHNTGDPSRAIGGNMRNPCRSFGAESVEKRG